MVRRRTAFTLAILLVLAGCTGSTGQPTGDLTVTPAPVPADGTLTPAYRLAPGLSESGVVGPLTLADAHAERLRSTVYRVRITERVEGADGRVTRRILEGTFANRTAFLFTVAQGTANETTLVSSFYADGDRLYERLVTDGEVRYYVPRRTLHERAPYPQVRLGSPTQHEELYVALAGARPGFDETVTRSGDRYHMVSATAPADPDFLAAMAYVDAITAYEFEAVVTDDGVVRSYRIEYEAVVDGERRRVVRTARWTGVGTAIVPVPTWYETARNRTAP